MIMKKLICLALATVTANYLFAQTHAGEHEWKMTLQVSDESGNPVMGANAGVGFYTNSTPTGIDGKTDTNGIFIAAFSSETSEVAYPLSFRVEKQGYYFTWAQHDLGQGYDLARWNFTQTLVLRRIGKPIAMYARLVDENPPTLGQPIGYDLMIGDWVWDGHKGSTADIIFQKWAYRKSGADYEYKVKVTFPKPGDGIQTYTIPDSEMGSGLRSPHEAPLDGYQPELDKERSAHPGQAAKNDDDPNRIYLFRVRTAKDHEGNIVSAHYGKIYGDFMQFRYYLNPTPNDRNIEFDPKQNLLQGLQSFETVQAP
jgi:hypothetical protein